MESVPIGTEEKLSEYLYRYLTRIYNNFATISMRLKQLETDVARLLQAQYTLIVPFEYVFKTNVTIVAPPTGAVSFNNASGPLVTRICMSLSTNNGLDISRILKDYATGDKILYQNDADKTQLIFFQLTGNVVMHTTVWCELPVVYIQGVESFNNNAKLTVTTVVTRPIEIPATPVVLNARAFAVE